MSEEHWIHDFPKFSRNFLKVKNKAEHVVPFSMNEAQLYIHNRLEEQKCKTGMVRASICKGRQQGCGTLIEGRFFYKVVTRFGLKTFILTNEQTATDNLFGMTQRYYEHYPDRPKLAAVGAGRSSTAQLFHGCLGAGIKVIDGLTMELKDISEMVIGDYVITHKGEVARVYFGFYRVN